MRDVNQPNHVKPCPRSGCSRERGRPAGEPAAGSRNLRGARGRERRGDPRGAAGIGPVEAVPRDRHGDDHHQGWTVRAEII